MATVQPILTDGKPDHIDWTTGEVVYADDPDFYVPTPEEEREAAEIFATMRLDSFMPRNPSFKVFLAEQARQAAIREGDPNFVWLGSLLAEHAARAMFLSARTPQQYAERCEVLEESHKLDAEVRMIRTVATLVDSPVLAAELGRIANSIERRTN